jgi:hypothetical protein
LLDWNREKRRPDGRHLFESCWQQLVSCGVSIVEEVLCKVERSTDEQKYDWYTVNYQNGVNGVKKHLCFDGATLSSF